MLDGHDVGRVPMNQEEEPMELRSGNPALSDNTFRGLEFTGAPEEAMTVGGTVNKTALLLALVALTSGWTWHIYAQTQNAAAVTPWMIGGAIGGLIVALITTFKMRWSPITAPIYALLEGLFIGGVSSVLESQYPGIVVQAVGLTFGTLAALLMVYKSGIIKVTENFKMGVVAATGGIFLVYLATIVLGFFGVSVPYIHGSGTIGIGFSIFVVVIASLNLVLDFDFIKQGAASGAPSYMEWYGAFALMVTLIWLYIEILRLLTKLRSRQ
jgi:uncharacterized YccA/Bax inhibitor family protein